VIKFLPALFVVFHFCGLMIVWNEQVGQCVKIRNLYSMVSDKHKIGYR